MTDPLDIAPARIQYGDPVALATLCERRGGAVYAYCEQVAIPSQTVTAASDAFAHFRVSVSGPAAMSGEEAEVDPAQHDPPRGGLARCEHRRRARRTRRSGQLRRP